MTQKPKNPQSCPVWDSEKNVLLDNFIKKHGILKIAKNLFHIYELITEKEGKKSKTLNFVSSIFGLFDHHDDAMLAENFSDKEFVPNLFRTYMALTCSVDDIILYEDEFNFLRNLFEFSEEIN